MERQKMIKVELREGEAHLSRQIIEKQPDGTFKTHRLSILSLNPTGQIKIEPYTKELPLTLYHDFPLLIDSTTSQLYELH